MLKCNHRRTKGPTIDLFYGILRLIIAFTTARLRDKSEQQRSNPFSARSILMLSSFALGFPATILIFYLSHEAHSAWLMPLTPAKSEAIVPPFSHRPFPVGQPQWASD